jgi:hypothetical protein
MQVKCLFIFVVLVQNDDVSRCTGVNACTLNAHMIYNETTLLKFQKTYGLIRKLGSVNFIYLLALHTKARILCLDSL